VPLVDERKRSNRIVACAIDDKYLWPFFVSLYSMHQNCTLPFRIVLGFDPSLLSLNSLNLIRDYVKFLNLEIEFFEVNLEGIQKRNMQHVSSSSYIRFSIFDEYPHSVLWVDADTICLPGWEGFFEFPKKMTQEQIVIATQDPIVLEEGFGLGPLNAARVRGGSKYFNTGIVFLDTHKWRDLDGPSLWKVAYQNYFKLGLQYEDQCILNYVLMDKVMLIDGSYNYLVNRNMDAPPEIRVIHFAGSFKPWHIHKFIFLFAPLHKARKYFMIHAHYENKLLLKSVFLDFTFFYKLLRLRKSAKKTWLIFEIVKRKLF
jgi:lipopolysaccharide biosynthesis glycosyltransferase